MNRETKRQGHKKKKKQSGILEIISHNKILKFREDSYFSGYLKLFVIV